MADEEFECPGCGCPEFRELRRGRSFTTTSAPHATDPSQTVAWGDGHAKKRVACQHCGKHFSVPDESEETK